MFQAVLRLILLIATRSPPGVKHEHLQNGVSALLEPDAYSYQ
ncbi:hypothetical protein PS710_05341 [Pseudomonas fluorescens]|uniref:Uncharacterized protein n=1 Tax=Pseudomonas fluorescens TaxID=294 RepID=A0A5E7FA76_PSEFL|nr:hypothetical protein PS710_05341 [Pseudomonas fluorescens]